MCLPLNHGTRIYVKTHEIDNNIIIIKHTNNKHTKLDKEEKMKIRYDIWCKLVNLSTRIIIITNYEKKMQIFVFLQFFFTINLHIYSSTISHVFKIVVEIWSCQVLFYYWVIEILCMTCHLTHITHTHTYIPTTVIGKKKQKNLWSIIFFLHDSIIITQFMDQSLKICCCLLLYKKNI